ncbi:hypothetical protein PHMEG_00014096 [Phytophthora megakarya]|uniref:EF-1-gamma C-terminal domain-containing protein n=1 Tax=Phytophthora megakarya TaxID=4795 RepID=A0A225W664_9STRA|nr:hypothetical protein PHMEG_00014096 [Phytophthora megakarya]
MTSGGYSLWFSDYNYTTNMFMACNAVGGFLQCSEANVYCKTGIPINGKVLASLEIETEDGTITKNFDGVVKPWVANDGASRHFCEIDFTDQDITTEPYDVQELAEVLNYINRSEPQLT